MLALVWGFIMSMELGSIIKHNPSDKGKLLNGHSLNYTIWKRGKLRTTAESITRSLNENFVFGLPSGRPAAPRIGDEYEHFPIFSSSILIKGKGEKRNKRIRSSRKGKNKGLHCLIY